ncbi:MAG: indole-3-glycerol phosphate synthase TrpC [Spirochaetaceae bacterium]|jgi:indole-3-glycerol phosphate synthase|nr:indole-3-glycerol phosphate synthase TrpC [Spirochaetaceae bacterium]
MILDDIAAATRKRIDAKKKAAPPAQVESEALAAARRTAGIGEAGVRFEKALSAPGLSFICEIKRASPSKGIIAEEFPYLKIAEEYAQAGAAAVSVLTEPDFFKGGDDYLREIAGKISLPLLRKDFILDSYQIYEAKLLGASAVLLICALLDEKTLAGFIKTASTLGLAAIVEAHDERETAAALAAGARIVGVNNRDLKTFNVDIGLSLRLRRLVPSHVLFVAESGIRSAGDVRALVDSGADAALIGEALMRSSDKTAYLNMLRQAQRL